MAHTPCCCPIARSEMPSFFWQAYKARPGHQSNTMQLMDTYGTYATSIYFISMLCWWPLPLLLELLVKLCNTSRGFRQNGPWRSISNWISNKHVENNFPDLYFLHESLNHHESVAQTVALLHLHLCQALSAKKCALVSPLPAPAARQSTCLSQELVRSVQTWSNTFQN